MTKTPTPKIVVLSISVALFVAIVLLALFARQGQVQNVNGEHQPEPKLELPALSKSDYDWIAAGIYQNEARGQSRYLTFWGEGEEFPSFGIGHFIWFPSGVDAPFDEMFPDMFAYVRQQLPRICPCLTGCKN